MRLTKVMDNITVCILSTACILNILLSIFNTLVVWYAIYSSFVLDHINSVIASNMCVIISMIIMSSTKLRKIIGKQSKDYKVKHNIDSSNIEFVMKRISLLFNTAIISIIVANVILVVYLFKMLFVL